jgi:hypothetical protein
MSVAAQLSTSKPRHSCPWLSGSSACDGYVSFHHLSFWTDRLASSSRDLDAHGWPSAATVAGFDKDPSRFTLHQSPLGFYVEIFDAATPRHADLLPDPAP